MHARSAMNTSSDGCMHPDNAQLLQVKIQTQVQIMMMDIYVHKARNI